MHVRKIFGTGILLLTLTALTDGSKTKDGVGAGFVVYYNKQVIQSGSVRLHSSATVFQAEVYAIRLGCQFISGHTTIFPRFLKILSYSQAPILVIKSCKIKSTLVLDTLWAFEILASQVKKLTLAWTKAHAGTPGNKLADTAAKTGADDTTLEEHNIPLPNIYNRDLIREAIREQWKKEWKQEDRFKHTKRFYAQPDASKAKHLLKFSKASVTRLVKIITGHNFLSYFQFRIDNSVNPYCRLCK